MRYAGTFRGTLLARFAKMQNPGKMRPVTLVTLVTLPKPGRGGEIWCLTDTPTPRPAGCLELGAWIFPKRDGLGRLGTGCRYGSKVQNPSYLPGLGRRYGYIATVGGALRRIGLEFGF